MKRDFTRFLSRLVPARLQQIAETIRFERVARPLLYQLWMLRDSAAGMDARFGLRTVVNDVDHVAWNSVMFTRLKSADFLEKFARAKVRATQHGVDVSRVINENGGEPDFEPFGIRIPMGFETLLWAQSQFRGK